ncbi:hypothetical protein [Halovulum marinum]|nr:hypothetical protein [Halovulum marinum]
MRRYLAQVRDFGINHVALDLRFTGADMEDTMLRQADEILPDFHG